MSSSALWCIKKNWSGEILKEYKNSWNICPTIWNLLLVKYIKPEERIFKYQNEKIAENYLSWLYCENTLYDNSTEKHQLLNERIMESNCEADKVVWDFSLFNVFNYKDKDFVADCFLEFISSNREFFNECTDELKESFITLINDIRNIPRRSKYFVFHGSSCDDEVEYWFYRKRLSSWKEVICYFVIIENNKIIDYKSNLDILKEDDS